MPCAACAAAWATRVSISRIPTSTTATEPLWRPDRVSLQRSAHARAPGGEMKKYAPLATLVAVVLLGAGLLAANMLSNPANKTTSAAAAAPSAVAAAPTGPAAAAPESAPAAAPAVAEKAYTGRSSGNEVTVAIAVKNGKAVAYACDGKKIEAWLEGTLTGDTLSLSGKTSSITATLDDKASFGTVTVDGKEWPFSAKGVASPAGLYEGRGNVDG